MQYPPTPKNPCAKYKTTPVECLLIKECEFYYSNPYIPCPKRDITKCVGFGDGTANGRIIICEPPLNPHEGLNYCRVFWLHRPGEPPQVGCEEQVGACRQMGTVLECVAMPGCQVSFHSNNPLDFYCTEFKTINGILGTGEVNPQTINNWVDGKTINYNCGYIGIPEMCTGQLILTGAGPIQVGPEITPINPTFTISITVITNTVDKKIHGMKYAVVYLSRNGGQKIKVKTIERAQICPLDECCVLPMEFKIKVTGNVPGDIYTISVESFGLPESGLAANPGPQFY